VDSGILAIDKDRHGIHPGLTIDQVAYEKLKVCHDRQTDIENKD